MMLCVYDRNIDDDAAAVTMGRPVMVLDYNGCEMGMMLAWRCLYKGMKLTTLVKQGDTKRSNGHTR